MFLKVRQSENLCEGRGGRCKQKKKKVVHDRGSTWLCLSYLRLLEIECLLAACVFNSPSLIGLRIFGSGTLGSLTDD